MPINPFAGITSSLDSMQRRNYEQAEIDRIRQQMDLSAFIIDQQKKEQDRQQRIETAIGRELSSEQVRPPPSDVTPATAVPPGQSSQPVAAPPMMRAFGPQGGQPAPTGGTPPMFPQGPLGTPTPGWRMSPQAMGASPPPAQPDQVAPPPAPAPIAPPKAFDSPEDLAKALTKRGLPPDEIYRAVVESAPIFDRKRSAVIQTLHEEAEVYKAKAAAEKETRERFALERGDPLKDTRTPFSKEVDDAVKRGEMSPEEASKARRAHISRMDAPARTTIGAAGGGSDDLRKDPETMRFMAEQYWAGDKSVLTNLGRGVQGAKNVVALRQEIAKIGKESGKTPQQLATAMAEFEGMKAGERSLGTRTAQIETAATEARSLADLARDASEKVTRTGIKSLNSAIQAVQKGTASPELRAFVASNTSLINAYARAINPQGVGTVADKEHAREMLDTAFSKGDYKAAVDQLMKEIDAALKAPKQVKASMRGDQGEGKVVDFADLK